MGNFPVSYTYQVRARDVSGTLSDPSNTAAAITPSDTAAPNAPTNLLAIVVGISYFIGAFIPILPVLLGATGPLPSILTSGVAILCVSYVLAFLSGMNVRRRILMNLFFIFAAVSISSVIGFCVRSLWGVAI